MNMIYVDVVRTGQVRDATTMSVLVHVFVIAVEVLQVQTVDFVSIMPSLNMRVLVSVLMIGLESYVIAIKGFVTQYVKIVAALGSITALTA